MRLNLRQAMLDAHANTRRSLLCWNLGVVKPSYCALFAGKLAEQMQLQIYLASPAEPSYCAPFRTYDERQREARLSASRV